ncbi:MAG: hypothetical protein J6D28_00530 [Bacilli bacterium]|nr:hypothetical protein [Bacilli bacterium]
MTDTQKQRKIQELNEWFKLLNENTIEELIEKFGEEELNDKRNKFYQNIYYRYKIKGENRNSNKAMGADSAKLLEDVITSFGLSIEEFLNSKGNFEKIIELLNKNKSNLKKMTLEELEKLKETKISEKKALTKYTTERGKALYKLSDELIKENKEKIAELSTEIASISKEINMRISESEIEIIDCNEIEIIDCSEFELDKYKKQTDALKELHQLEVKKFEDKLKTISSENKSLQEENETLKTRISDYIELLKEQKNKLLEQNEQTKKQLKEEIIELLLTKPILTYKSIQSSLSTHIELEYLKSIMLEVKEEIPGLWERILPDGKNSYFTLGNNNRSIIDNYSRYLTELNLLGQAPIKNRTLKFIVRSDLHLDMKYTQDDMKQLFEPYFNFSAENENASIIDLGDIADTYKYYDFNDYKNASIETIKLSYNFFKNYAESISTSKDTLQYTLIGNHDIHPFYAGINPIKLMQNYSDNFRYIGTLSGSLKIKNLKIGLFHGITPDAKYALYNSASFDTQDFRNKLNKLSEQYDMMLIGHYHRGKIYTANNAIIVRNGIKNSILLTVNIENNEVESVCADLMFLSQSGKLCSCYQAEIYNKNSAKCKKIEQFKCVNNS